MATKLTKFLDRAVQNRAGHDLTVRMAPEGVYVRGKGRRHWDGPVDYGRIHLMAAAITTGLPDVTKPRPKPHKGRKAVSRGLLTI